MVGLHMIGMAADEIVRSSPAKRSHQQQPSGMGACS
eukprot:COSAG06_NODE_67178_length_252_cov_1.235294_1_plen_35_part_01